MCIVYICFLPIDHNFYKLDKNKTALLLTICFQCFSGFHKYFCGLFYQTDLISVIIINSPKIYSKRKWLNLNLESLVLKSQKKMV